MELTDAKFDDLWGEISEALVRIAAHLSHVKRDEWKKAIDKFLRNPLTSEEERCVEELNQWYKKDMDVKDAVENLGATYQEGIAVLQEDLKGGFERVETRLQQEVQDLRKDLQGQPQRNAGKKKNKWFP